MDTLIAIVMYMDSWLIVIALVCAAIYCYALSNLARAYSASKSALYKSDADELVRVLVHRRARLEQAKNATNTPYRSCGCHCHSENNKPRPYVQKTKLSPTKQDMVQP